MSIHVPYYFVDGPGSKKPKLGELILPYSDDSAVVTEEIGAFDRRRALKVALAGTLATTTLCSGARQAEANPGVLWWLARTVFVAAAKWVVGKLVSSTLDYYAGDYTQRQIDNYITHLPQRIEKKPLINVNNSNLQEFEQREIHELHRATMDDLQFTSAANFDRRKLDKYDRESSFEVKKHIGPVDAQMREVWAVNQLEAKDGRGHDSALVAKEHRASLTAGQLATRAIGTKVSVDARLQKAIKAYELDAEITADDVHYFQRTVNSEGHTKYVFGLKPEKAAEAKYPSLII